MYGMVWCKTTLTNSVLPPRLLNWGIFEQTFLSCQVWVKNMLLVGHLLSVPRKMESKHKGVANLCLKSPLSSLHHPHFYHLFPLICKKHMCTQTDTHGGGLFPACHSRWSETSDPDRIFQQVNLLVSIIHTEVRLMLLMFFVVKPYDKVQQQVIAR